MWVRFGDSVRGRLTLQVQVGVHDLCVLYLYLSQPSVEHFVPMSTSQYLPLLLVVVMGSGGNMEDD